MGIGDSVSPGYAAFNSSRHQLSGIAPFAVHRLTAWYREGADVQRLLPVLSTYLGHVDPSGTQVYLPMTPELLQQAALRFEHYARGGDHECCPNAGPLAATLLL